MAASPATSSLYEVLKVSAYATSQEVKATYRRLARVSHPDVVAMNQKETSTKEFMKIHAAYSTLLDPAKRANYDRGLYPRRWGVNSALYMASALGASRFTRRNWETEQCW